MSRWAMTRQVVLMEEYLFTTENTHTHTPDYFV